MRKNFDVGTMVYLYTDEVADIYKSCKIVDRHQSWLAGVIYGKFSSDRKASEYRLNHSAKDLVLEARKVSRQICWLNTRLRKDRAFGDGFLSRRYDISPAVTPEDWNRLGNEAFAIIAEFEDLCNSLITGEEE